MRPLSKTLLYAAALLSPFAAKSEVPDSISVSAEVVQTISSGDHTPFWLVSNRQGLSSIEKGSGYVRVGARKDLDSQKRFSWGACVDVAAPWRFTSDFVVQQLYGEIKYRSLDLTVGAKEYWSETLDRNLSSGGLLYSGNARPIPQVRAGIFDYQPLHFTNDWVAIKGYLAYGAFTDARWEKNWVANGHKRNSGVLYCSRGLWFRNGDPERFPLVFTAGIEMGTQFGGKCYNFYLQPDEKFTLKMPSGPMAWLKALLPLEGDDSTVEGEQTNVEGNMIGTYDFSLAWIPGADWKVKAYWQHMFEDHSMLWIDFPWKDGLWGVQGWLPKNPIISSVVFEFLYSKFQSGSVYNDSSPEVPEQVSGMDMYYFHYLYSGWQHWGMGMGNPFSISPIYNEPHTLIFRATRNISYHIGLEGRPSSSIGWKILASNTRSWGHYQNPFLETRSMWNFLASIDWSPATLRGCSAHVSLGWDRGDLIGDSFGVMLGFSYDINVPIKNKQK